MQSILVTNSPSSNKVVNNTGNKVTISFSVPINLDDGKQYQLRLLQGEITYCMPNITSKNNKFKYSYNSTNYIYN